MAVIRKLITTKEHAAFNLCKMARRSYQLLLARGVENPRDYKYLTSWVLYRAKNDDWEELVNTATMQNLLEDALKLDSNSQELIFEDWMLLPK